MQSRAGGGGWGGEAGEGREEGKGEGRMKDEAH